MSCMPTRQIGNQLTYRRALLREENVAPAPFYTAIVLYKIHLRYKGTWLCNVQFVLSEEVFSLVKSLNVARWHNHVQTSSLVTSKKKFFLIDN